MNPNFAIDWLKDGARVVVRVSGELDLSTAPAVHEHLRLAGQQGVEIVVDLERATFMDCAGLRPLLQTSAATGPAMFSVTQGPPQVQRLFQVAGITGVLRIARRSLTLGRRTVERAR